MTEDWQNQPPVTRAVVTFAGALVTLSTDGLDYTIRMTGKAETFLDESIGFLRDARPLVVALSHAVDTGLIDDVRSVMRITESTLTQLAAVSAHLDSAAGQIAKILPTVDKTAQGMRKMLPVIETLPATQEDIRAARDAVQQVQALVNATVGQLDVIPGAKLVKGIGGGVVDSLTGRGAKTKPQPEDVALF